MKARMKENAKQIEFHAVLASKKRFIVFLYQN